METNITSAPSQPLPRAWQLFKDALIFYKGNFKAVFEIFFTPFVLMAIGSVLLASFNASFNGSEGELRGGLISFSFGIIFLIAGGVLSYFATIGFIKYLVQKERGFEYSGLKDTFTQGVKLFFPFLWVSILMTLTVMGGLILLIIPGVILSFYLSLGMYVLIDEDKRGLAALVSSWNYVRGYAWNLFRKSIFFVVMWIPLLILGAIIVGAVAFFSFKSGIPVDGGSTFYNSFQILFRLVQQVLVTPVSIVFFFLIYKNLKRIKTETIVASTAEEDKNKRKKLLALSIIGAVTPFIIIGILSTVILASLQTARMNAKEAAQDVQIKQQDVQDELDF